MVPMDFGIEYLECPAHGNLKFLLQNNEELFANSAIMSFNSPVIKRLTIEDGRSTVDVQDFPRNTMRCFLESTYSGELKIISKLIFRDMNKLAHSFQVTWLVDACFDHFQSLTEAVKVNNFDDQRFVFEEAMFILNRWKKQNYLETVIKKFTSLVSYTEYFATHYLADISSRSAQSLDLIMEMTKDQEHILVKVIINNLETEKQSLNQNSRHVLEKLDFTSCPKNHASLYRKLFERLENMESPSVEDFKVIVRIMRQSNKVLNEMESYVSVPNLFHDFLLLQDIDNLDEVAILLSEPFLLSNSYVFYDSVYAWLCEKYFVNNTLQVSITDSFIKKFDDLKTKRGWKPLSREYVQNTSCKLAESLRDKILQNSNLITSDNYYRAPSNLEYTPDELFGRDHDIIFRLEKDPTKNCSKERECGFILRVTAASGKQDSSFNIELVIDPELYPDDVHYHEESSTLIENCHLSLDITSSADNYYKDMPGTWNSKPCRDGTN